MTPLGGQRQQQTLVGNPHMGGPQQRLSVVTTVSSGMRAHDYSTGGTNTTFASLSHDELQDIVFGRPVSTSNYLTRGTNTTMTPQAASYVTQRPTILRGVTSTTQSGSSFSNNYSIGGTNTTMTPQASSYVTQRPTILRGVTSTTQSGSSFSSNNYPIGGMNTTASFQTFPYPPAPSSQLMFHTRNLAGYNRMTNNPAKVELRKDTVKRDKPMSIKSFTMDQEFLNDLLECSVCLEQLDGSSKVLPCQHTFCKRCLYAIFDTHKELRCPVCRKFVFAKIEDLPCNFLLVRLLDGMKNKQPKTDGSSSDSAPKSVESSSKGEESSMKGVQSTPSRAEFSPKSAESSPKGTESSSSSQQPDSFQEHLAWLSESLSQGSSATDSRVSDQVDDLFTRRYEAVPGHLSNPSTMSNGINEFLDEMLNPGRSNRADSQTSLAAVSATATATTNAAVTATASAAATSTASAAATSTATANLIALTESQPGSYVNNQYRQVLQNPPYRGYSSGFQQMPLNLNVNNGMRKSIRDPTVNFMNSTGNHMNNTLLNSVLSTAGSNSSYTMSQTHRKRNVPDHTSQEHVTQKRAALYNSVGQQYGAGAQHGLTSTQHPARPGNQYSPSVQHSTMSTPGYFMQHFMQPSVQTQSNTRLITGGQNSPLPQINGPPPQQASTNEQQNGPQQNMPIPRSACPNQQTIKSENKVQELNWIDHEFIDTVITLD